MNIQYRPYIYDRYNWDSCKPTDIPMAGAIDWLMDETLVAKVTALKNKCGAPYISRNGSKYTVQDDLMGSLVESGDARNFDIVGGGVLKTVRISREDPAAPIHLATPPSGAATPEGAKQRGGS